MPLLRSNVCQYCIIHAINSISDSEYSSFTIHETPGGENTAFSEEYNEVSGIIKKVGRDFRENYKPRRAASRRRLSISDPNLVNLLSEYRTWVNYTEWLVFQGIEDLGPHEVPLVRYKVAKAAKRGNDVYNWRVRKRLKLLDEVKSRPHTLGYFSRGIAKPLTGALFITLTFSRDLPLGELWGFVGPQFDKWRSRIRSKYGKFEFIRCWEAHRDGYPHIHILLVFQDAEFTVFRYNRKYRIAEKADFEWGWGWVDVQACRDLKDGISYIAKYIGKVHLLGDEALTLALTWFYGKRGWSMSRAFNDLIRALHNPNKPSSYGEESPHIKWFLMGFWGAAPLQLILDDAGLGFTKEILAPQYWSMYGKQGWTDFNPRSSQVYDCDDRWGCSILQTPRRLRGGE